MRTVTLTDEQAAWLLSHLNDRAEQRAWDAPERTDSDEHTDAIRAKLKAEIEKHSWERRP